MKAGKKLRWAFVSLALVVVALAGTGVIAFQPRVANHFGYALPGADGLPFRISYQGHYYINLATCAGADWCRSREHHSLCVTRAELVQDNTWPLAQVGSVATLFGASHPMLVDPASEGLQLHVFVANGTDCYVAYAIQGSP